MRKRVKNHPSVAESGLFFGLKGGQADALTPRTVQRIVVKSAKKPGIPRVTALDLRRSCATHFSDWGCPHVLIMQLLGLTTLSVTERYIGSASPERLKRVYARARAMERTQEQSWKRMAG